MRKKRYFCANMNSLFGYGHCLLPKLRCLMLDYNILISIVPEFRVGFLNAWIGTFVILLLPLMFRWIIGKREFKRAGTMEEYNKAEKKLIDYTMAVFYLTVLYSIVLPLKLGTNGFYAGAFIYLVALSGLLATYYSFYSSPGGQLVTSGVFRISRNPFYFYTSIAFLGVGIASLSWLLILLTIIFAILQHGIVLAEERICELNYGKEYLEYKKNVPRYFLFF